MTMSIPTKSEVNKEELCFYGSDPGAVKHGNFINYYSFHDVQERINNLHPQMFPTPIDNKLICLDIGCNTGDLTKAVYEYLKSLYPNCDIHILAVDIDSALIFRAKESNSYPYITFSTSNIMSEEDRLPIIHFLKSYKRMKFDIVFCFSVTMWIHLNNGDNGLLEFLQYLKSISNTIVIEPQPWKCYRKAQKRVKKSGNTFELYNHLKIKSGVDIIIENILKTDLYCKIYESPSSSWDRKVQSFQLTMESVNKC
ncbi:unnamed protein product [Arctia plantaginis]|uniref:RNA methyltransferase n=1 Tax=Arctia plantaginis TaxID=874455 RepID=A0A8S0ZDF5_ARCPL|nr:unnamed protein product [Arctia plantaginis]